MDQELSSERKLPEKIQLYRSGRQVTSDIRRSLTELRGVSLAHLLDPGRLLRDRNRPIKTTHFEAPCPRAMEERGSFCPKEKMSWKCVNCLGQVGFSKRILVNSLN